MMYEIWYETTLFENMKIHVLVEANHPDDAKMKVRESDSQLASFISVRRTDGVWYLGQEKIK